MTLAQQFAAYTDWRSQLIQGIERYRGWLSANELCDAQTMQRFARLLEKLREDRLRVAFVAEFSRGKSELINAIFFAEYGNRMLPSTAGRTTMCPTELLFDPNVPARIELLPIETRETNIGISEYRQSPEMWKTVALDTTSSAAMYSALRSVSEVQRVPLATAQRLGFMHGDPETFGVDAADGAVEIPRWRHAVINFPHPLLRQGLVILDTPGLNAIGAEPELTLSMLPNADAVIFILAADTGVTLSDMTIWKEHIGAPGGRRRGHLVVLNKIDGLWDELRSTAEIDAEIAEQAESCAKTLDLPLEQIFPVSAQKGLVAKINDDAALFERSRLGTLERALAEELIPAKREIVLENTQDEFFDIDAYVRNLLDLRLADLREQLGELVDLRGKNKGVVEYMMNKIVVEKDEFEASLQRYRAVRSVFSQISGRLFEHIGLDAMRNLAAATRQAMRGATFSKTLSGAMRNFFKVARGNLERSEREIKEIHTMLEAVYRKFVVEHGLKLGAPVGFSLAKHLNEIDRLKAWCDTHLNTVFQLMTHDKSRVTQKFFEEITTQVRRSFEYANRDSEAWLKAVMAPIETQVREHQSQFKRRFGSVKRIHQATETLEDRIKELNDSEDDLLRQVRSAEDHARTIRQLLAQSPLSAGRAPVAKTSEEKGVILLE